MKRNGLLILVCCIALISLLACAAPAPAPQPAPAPAPAPSAAPAPAPAPAPSAKPVPATTAAPAPGKVWNLRFATEDSLALPIWANALVPWTKQIEEATKGRVKVTIYPDSAISKPADSWTAITTGLADITRTTTGYYTGQFPLTEVITLPSVGGAKAEFASRIAWKLQEEFPSIQAEYAPVKLISLFTTEPYFLIARKPVRTVDDFKGMKLRALGGAQSDLTKAVGAVPITLPFGDVYIALQKGTLDGAWTISSGLTTYKQFEVTGYYMNIRAGMSVFWVVFNKDVWNGMPKDIQDAIMGLSGDTGSGKFGAVYDQVKASALKEIKDKYNYEFKEIVDMSPEEMAKFNKIAGSSTWDAWADKWKGRGPTRDILNRELELEKQFYK